jgi:hypothetical protein
MAFKFTLSNLISFVKIFIVGHVDEIAGIVGVQHAEVLSLEFWLDLLTPLFQGSEVWRSLAQSLGRSGSAHLHDEFLVWLGIHLVNLNLFGNFKVIKQNQIKL